MTTPRQIGGYDITERIGSVPLGEAFAGRDADDRPVTLLRLHRSDLAKRQDLETLLQSVKELKDLEIEDMLPPIGTGLKGEHVIIVIRGTDGATLENILARGPLEVGRAIGIARRVSECLDRLHAAGMPHGDVRPGTIHLPGGGDVRLGPPAFLPTTTTELEAPWVAPEVLEGGVGDASSDVFSLGTILYRALTGSPPFFGETAKEVLASIRDGDLDDAGRHASGLPAGLDQLLAEMLHVSPDRRPRDASTRLRTLEKKAEEEAFPIIEAAPGVEELPAAPAAPKIPPRPAAPRIGTKVPKGPRTRVGRLVVPIEGKDDSITHDLIDERIHLGVDAKGRIHLSSEEFPGSLCHVAREPECDAVETRPDAAERPRANGSLFDRHELEEGDVLTIGGRDLKYELEPPIARPVTRAPAAAGVGPKGPSRTERVFLLTSIGLCVLVLVGLGLAYRDISTRDQDVIDRAEAARIESKGRVPGAISGDDSRDGSQAALDEALALGRDNPRDYVGRRKLLEAVIDRHPGTRASRKAADALAAFDREEAQAEMQELADAIGEADRLVDDGRLHDASRLYRAYAKRWPNSQSAARAERNAQRIEGKILLRWEADGERIDALEKDGDLVGAIDVLGRVLVYANPTVEEQARKRIQILKRRIDETLHAPADGAGPEDGEPAKVDEPKKPADAPKKPIPEARDPIAEAERRSEERAQKVYDAAFEDARTGLFGRVRELARLLLGPLSRTKVAKENRQQIEDLFRLATLEADGPTGLLHGKVERLAKGRIRVSYDFREPKQLEDWRYLKPFAVPEGGSFEPVKGEACLQGLGAGAFLLDLVCEGDLALSFRMRSERPHDIGPAFFEPDNEMRHILFTVSNTFFTLSIRREPLPGHVIMLFGSGMWADTPNAELGFIKTAQSEKPTVHAGSWIYMAATRKKKKAYFKIGESVLEGTTVGDNGKSYGDLRPAFFVLKSRAQFADVVVEGKPSRMWYAEHKQKLRKLLDLR